MLKAIGFAVVLLAMAAPAAAQSANGVLREARELAGMDPDVLRIVQLVARTETQAARYCEVNARYGQALRADYAKKYRAILATLLSTPQDLEYVVNRAVEYAGHFQWEAGLLSISVAANTDAERDRLSQICAQAYRAAQPQGR
jgi:hypothetical protein